MRLPCVRLLSCIAGLMLFQVAATAAVPTIEYQVKASFLYNFIQFVEWPDTVFSSPEDSIVIAVFGEDRLGSALDSLSLAKAKGHPIKVKRCQSVDDVAPAHVLFLTNSTQGDAAEILKKVNTNGMLTIGEERDFVKDGGVINFVLKDDRVRFEINLASASDSGLTLSSQLLKLALKIYEDDVRTNR
jgi:hypothetical protein